MIRNLLCRIGIHKYDQTEVHVYSDLPIKNPYEAAVVIRCACGRYRFITNKQVTRTVVSKDNYDTFMLKRRDNK